MKPRSLFALVAAGALTAGCGSSKGLTGPGGSGGTLDGAGGSTGGAAGGSAGGAVMDGGGAGGTATGGAGGKVTAGAGGIGTGGKVTGGTGGTATGGTGGTATGGTGGAAGGGGSSNACVDPGVSGAFPWWVTGPDGGQPGSLAPDGGSPPVSGCQRTTSSTGAPIYTTSTATVCAGPAWLRSVGGAPEVTWDDGSRMYWPPNLAVTWPLPLAADSPDRRVSAKFEYRTYMPCPCGGYRTLSMEVRDGVTGKPMFVARDGVNTDLTATELMDVLGVATQTVTTCQFDTHVGCESIRRTRDNHVLQTTPPVTLLPGTVQRVLTPNGTFDLFWTSSSDQDLGRIQGCADGLYVGPPYGFVANHLDAL